MADAARTTRRAGRGFTLVELLVVVSIIATLIAILLPALSRTRESARSVVCLSNLRQMALAAHTYASGNQGRYPISYYQQADGSMVCWDFAQVADPAQPSGMRVAPGLLWQGSGALSVQQCPSFDGSANWASDPYTGYNYNTSFIGHGQFESIAAPARTTDVRNPTRCALFGDGQWSAGANKFMRAPWKNPGDASFSGRYSGTQGYRHLGRTNVAFCDGHAESLAERHTATYTTDRPQVAPGTGFLSEDNSLYSVQ